jgi:hypothetical protein
VSWAICPYGRFSGSSASKASRLIGLSPATSCIRENGSALTAILVKSTGKIVSREERVSESALVNCARALGQRPGCPLATYPVCRNPTGRAVSGQFSSTISSGPALISAWGARGNSAGPNQSGEGGSPFFHHERYFLPTRWARVVFLRLAATFERVVSPDAAPIRAPDTAPVKAPVTARLKNPPIRLRLAASTVFCAPLGDLDFFLAMRLIARSTK